MSNQKIPTPTMFASIASVLGVVLLLVGCGNGNSSSPNSSLTPAQAQQVAAGVSDGLAQALAGGLNSSSTHDRQTARAMRKDESVPNVSGPSCYSSSSGEVCNWPISESFTCPGGGALSVSGDVSASMDNNGNGSVQAQIAEIPSGCSIDGIVINGNPQITVNGSLGISNWSPVWPLTLTETGGVTFGPNPAGACQFDLSVSVNADSSFTVSGMACGQQVSGTS